MDVPLSLNFFLVSTIINIFFCAYLILILACYYTILWYFIGARALKYFVLIFYMAVGLNLYDRVFRIIHVRKIFSERFYFVETPFLVGFFVGGRGYIGVSDTKVTNYSYVTYCDHWLGIWGQQTGRHQVSGFSLYVRCRLKLGSLNVTTHRCCWAVYWHTTAIVIANEGRGWTCVSFAFRIITHRRIKLNILFLLVICIYIWAIFSDFRFNTKYIVFFYLYTSIFT